MGECKCKMNRLLLFQVMNSTFQSYIIISNSPQKIRERTKLLAKSYGISLSKTSPDIFVISPAKNSITIDQIRNLKSHIFQKPVKSKFKFIIVESAHLATQEAQNALLKIFEEPPSAAIIVLESESKEVLLPTIISRAVVIKAQPQTKISSALLAADDLETALAKIPNIIDPKAFLDNQIIALTQLLAKNIRTNQKSSTQITKTIEKYKEAKLMIGANVNPTFVLTNLVLSSKL